MVKQSSFSTKTEVQRALVVHPHAPSIASKRTASAQLSETAGLAESIALEVVQAISFNIKQRTPRTLLGPGQVAQCRELATQHSLNVIIIGAPLSPTQQRNLEQATKCKVIDRTALILEIFGARARTAEGRLQVELAALTYQKSRLVRSWTHLERQRGGYGFMGGPGESQIETDRRLIAERITLIKNQLKKVVRTRELHRKPRRETPLPTVALVGYTNAGKSTLFNRLTKAKVLAEDQLFATLDPTIRATTLPSGAEILLSDTVGFIADLPHELVAAFRATLEEVREADILLHVRDISHPDTGAQADDVNDVLSELLGEDELATRPMIEVWNKIDLADAQALPVNGEQPVAALSALTGEGCEALLAQLDHMLHDHFYTEYKYQIAASSGRALAWLHEHGEVRTTQTEEEKIHISVALRPEDASRFESEFLP